MIRTRKIVLRSEALPNARVFVRNDQGDPWDKANVALARMAASLRGRRATLITADLTWADERAISLTFEIRSEHATHPHILTDYTLEALAQGACQLPKGHQLGTVQAGPVAVLALSQIAAGLPFQGPVKITLSQNQPDGATLIFTGELAPELLLRQLRPFLAAAPAVPEPTARPAPPPAAVPERPQRAAAARQERPQSPANDAASKDVARRRSLLAEAEQRGIPLDGLQNLATADLERAVRRQRLGDVRALL